VLLATKPLFCPFIPSYSGRKRVVGYKETTFRASYLSNGTQTASISDGKSFPFPGKLSNLDRLFQAEEVVKQQQFIPPLHGFAK
jgi:hypothetical protein